MQTMPSIRAKAMGNAAAKAIFALFLLLAGNCFADEPWLEEAAAQPPLMPPFKKTYYAGESGRVTILKERAIRLYQGPGSSRGTVIMIPLKSSKRAGPKEVMKEEPFILLDSTFETDEIAFKVVTGQVNLEADTEEMKEWTVEEGQKIEIPLTPSMESVGRFVNLSDFRSTVTYGFTADGADVSKTNDWDRTIALEFKASKMSKTWKVAADKLQVIGVRGKVLIKAGHPFSKGK